MNVHPLRPSRPTSFCCNIDTGASLLVPPNSLILDCKRLAAQLPRGEDRAPPDSTPSPGCRISHYVLQPKCSTWRASLPAPWGTTSGFFVNKTGLLAIIPAKGPGKMVNETESDVTSVDDTYDHIFGSCQHPLSVKARQDSDQLLNFLSMTAYLSTVDYYPFSVLATGISSK